MYHLGHFFIVIDPEAFMGIESFKEITTEILKELRASEKAPGQERIFTAGEKEFIVWQERKQNGVPINEGVQSDFIKVRDSFSINFN